MAINWIDAVIKNSKHKGSELLLLIMIANSADEATGTAYPGVELLAKRTRLSERVVQFNLRKLEASGEIRTERQASPYQTNLYHINKSLLGGDAGSGGAKISGVRETSPKGVRETSPNTSVEPSDKENTRAKQLPRDWEPSPDEVQYAKERGFTHAETADIAEDFRLYYHSHRRAMADWHLTWFRWVRTEAQKRQSRSTPRQSAQPSRPVYLNTEQY